MSDSKKLIHQLRLICENELEYEAPLTLRRMLSGVSGRVPSSVLALFSQSNSLGGDFLSSDLLLTERANHLSTHAAQVSFPGGVKELQDLGLKETALRETQEEVGVAVYNIQVVGSLPPFPTVTGKFEVVPYLAVYSVGAERNLQLSTEVAEGEWVSVLALRETRSLEKYVIHGVEVESPIFWWDAKAGPKKIWGVTGWILDLIFKRYDSINV